MKKIEVVLTGTGEGLLMHSAAAMTEQKPTKNPGKVYDNKKEAEKVAYRNAKGQLYIPSRCLKACILNAASWYKFGKRSAKQIIAGCTTIEPREMVLTHKKKPIKKYEIDTRPVVIQQSRIIRARPLIKDWEIKFDLIYNEKMIGNPKILFDILEEAGMRVGILDNRPGKSYGENGQFKVKKFLPK